MTALDTAKFYAKAPHSKKFAHMAKTAIESYTLFSSIRECYCENLDCPCEAKGCDLNANPHAHVEYMGIGNMCDRCCDAMPAKWHMDSCRCTPCLQAVDVRLQNAFTMVSCGSMDWVDSNKRANIRLRIERCHENTGPSWNDNLDGGYYGSYLDPTGY